MGRPSSPKNRKQPLPSTLRTELERQIERGKCAYCRAPARPDKPLTREHVIPRARGGRRKDVRIIVPACARCNHHRGCRDLIPFLLARPRRLSSFIDYLVGLEQDCIREVDLRIFAELYTAVAILNECAAHGIRWRWERERLCSGRSLHRRRYAARRAVGAVSDRMAAVREHDWFPQGPSCPLPIRRSIEADPLQLEEPLELMASRLLSLLALLWNVSAEIVEREMARELHGTAGGGASLVEKDVGSDVSVGEEGILPLDGWRARPRRRRHKVDRRQARLQRTSTPPRGRAA